MRLLILGGTRFVGRALASHALAEGHDLTLFHRHPTSLFPAARHLLCDREEGHTALAGRSFDAAIDVSGYVPRIVGDAARSVRADRYVFISSVAVYRPFESDAADEAAPLVSGVRDTEEIDGLTYGGLKVACEDELREIRPDASIVRSGIVGGAYDWTNRLTYYVRRFRRGGRMLVPPRPEQPLQIIDSRDLAAFLLLLAESGQGATFNAVGPDASLADLWQAGREIEPSLDFVPLDDPERFGLEGDTDLPLALPTDGSRDARWRISARAAEAAGLRRRPLAETVRDVDDWLRREDPGVEGAWFGTLTAEREADILREIAPTPAR